MIVAARINDISPFTDRVEFYFDDNVNLFIGPNASGKSTILRRLASKTRTPGDKFYFVGAGMPYIDEGMMGRVRERISTERFERLARVHDLQMPWVFIPPARLSIPFSDGTPEWLGELHNDVPDGLNQLLEHPKSQQHVFDGKIVYLAAEAINRQFLIGQGDTSKFDNMLKAKSLPYMCAQDICRDILRENEHSDYIQQIQLPLAEREVTTQVIHYDMGVGTTDTRRGGSVFLGDLSSGTQGTLLWIWYLALRIANFYDFADGWEEQPAVLLIDEIENHLHPTWQRRVIPALRKHFPGLQIFATTHSPFVVAGLKAGQVHLLERDENGVVSVSTNERDIIGWTISEILRALMGVDDPTDEQTATNAARLRDLRRKRASEEGLSDAEEDEMRDLRKSVSGDMLAGGALNAQRDRLADTLDKFMQSRLAKTPHVKTIVDYDRAIGISPNDAGTYHDRGDAYFELGEYAKAIADYGRAIAIDPNYYMAYNHRGDAYTGMGDYTNAIANYDRAISIGPNYTAAYLPRGQIYARIGEYAKAIADYDRAIAIDPNYYMAYNERGDAYAKMGEYDRAIADYDRAISIGPNYTAAYLCRGQVYTGTGEYAKAIADYDRAIAIDPNYTAAYRHRGHVYTEIGEYAKAIADYDRAIAIDRNVALAYNDRGRAHFNNGESAMAIEDYGRAIAIDPDLAVAYHNRGDAYTKIGEHDRATADYNRAVAGE